MSGWDLDQSEAKALDIWLSVRPHHESDIIDPINSSTISPAVDKLINYLTSPPEEYTDEFGDFNNPFTYVKHSLVEFCLSHPRSMDWAITVLFEVVKNIPNDFVCELGEGPEGARLDLERFLGDFTNLYSVGGTMPLVGTFPKGSFEVEFSAEDVKERPEDVIEKLKNERKSRRKTMTMQCFAARCHVLESPIHPHNKALDERLMAFIRHQLDFTRDSWNKVDCIGILTMLRGSASYLLSTLPEPERNKKKEKCISGLIRLLYTTGEGRQVGDKADDVQIKAHVAISHHSAIDILFFLGRNHEN